MSDNGRIGYLISIDDSEFDQMANRRIVERSGMVDQFRTFLDARDALEFLRIDRQRVDAILLDINMPVMDGFEFLDAATSEFGDDFAGIVVLMLTTSLVPSDRERACGYRAVRDFYSKPLTRELLVRIAEHLQTA
jgi:CheY-like chemotaxis protein